MTVDELIKELQNLSNHGYGCSTVCMLDGDTADLSGVSHASEHFREDQIVLVPNGVI